LGGRKEALDKRTLCPITQENKRKSLLERQREKKVRKTKRTWKTEKNLRR